MKYINKTFSISPPSTTRMACERCVYGRGPHREGCPTEKFQKKLKKLKEMASYSDGRESQ